MCLFCDIANSKTSIDNHPEDIIIDESPNFYVKSALGQFVDGYVLINTKKHLPNFSKLDPSLSTELDELINRTKSNISKLLGIDDFIIFEHGSINRVCFNKNCVAKCIDHAHLHLIPTSLDVLKELKNNFTFTEGKSDLELFKHNYKSYIFYCTSKTETKYVFKVNDKLPSQYLRQIICSKLEIEDKWNWAKYPFRERINAFNKLYIDFLSDSKKNKIIYEDFSKIA